jgi:alpha-L-rhamnosidase
VRIADNDGDRSDWSEVAVYEPLLLNQTGWPASFITAEQEEDATASKGKLLRKTFELDGPIVSAHLLATALGLYEVLINGRRVGEDLLTPGWTAYEKRLQVQTYDVTDYLQSGVNAIGAVVGTGWYRGNLAWAGKFNTYGSRSALSLQLVLQTADGREVRIVTDGTWKISGGPILYSEFYHGETYDARLEQPDWSLPDFQENGWQSATVVAQDTAILIAQENQPVRRQEILAVKQLIVTPKGEKVLDFGQNLTGWVRFRVQGQAGERVLLKHAEILDKDGNFYTENMRSAKNLIDYTLRGQGAEVFEPHFTFQGFRYVEVAEWPADQELDPASFAAVVIHTDFKQSGWLTTSNELLNQLVRNINWGLKGNFVDVPTDCPQRDERLGWTGDAQVFARTACTLRQAGPFFRKWLRDLAADQLTDGGVPFVIPDVLGKNNLADQFDRTSHSATGWGDAAVICPWTVWQVYGDRQILIDQYDSMKAWIGYIKAHAQDGVLWNTGFHFGDWLALDAREGSYFGATPNDLTATAFYAWSTQLMIQIAEALGKLDDAAEYRVLHECIVRAFQNEFFTPTGRLAVMTQTAHILALHFGLVPEAYKDRTVNSLLALLEKTGGHLETGFLGTPYFCQVLSDHGHLDRAYALLLQEDYPSWLYPVKAGATTIWEHWDGIKPDGSLWSKDMNSFNHYAYGSIGDWMFRHIAGINLDPAEPGYRHSLLRPLPGGGLTHAEGSVETLYGRLSLAWRLDGDVMSVDVTVPANTTASLVLPGTDLPEQKLGSGTWNFTAKRTGPSQD